MKGFLSAAEGLLLAFFIICAAVVTGLNFKPLYYHDIEALSISERSGFSVAEIKENYDAMVDYNNLWGPSELHFPTLDMSEGGRIHFQEVKALFSVFEIGLVVSGAAALALGLVLRRKGVIRHRLLGGIFTLAIPAVLGVFAAVAWDRFFVLFHQVFFDNDYWLFDARTDPVIRILPDEFFLHALILMLAAAALGALLLFLSYAAGRRRLRQ